MRETDPAQQAIDRAVIEAAREMRQREREDDAILFNNAVVKAFSSKG